MRYRTITYVRSWCVCTTSARARARNEVYQVCWPKAPCLHVRVRRINFPSANVVRLLKILPRASSCAHLDMLVGAPLASCIQCLGGHRNGRELKGSGRTPQRARARRVRALPAQRGFTYEIRVCAQEIVCVRNLCYSNFAINIKQKLISPARVSIVLYVCTKCLTLVSLCSHSMDSD